MGLFSEVADSWLQPNESVCCNPWPCTHWPVGSDKLHQELQSKLQLSDLMEKDAGLQVTGKAEYSFHSNNLDQNTS